MHTEATPWGLRFTVFSVLQILKIYGFLRAGSRAGSSVILCLSSHVSLVSLSGSVFINWVLVYKLMGWGGSGGRGGGRGGGGGGEEAPGASSPEA